MVTRTAFELRLRNTIAMAVIGLLSPYLIRSKNNILSDIYGQLVVALQKN